MAHRFKLGRKPRTFDSNIPHLSALLGTPSRRHYAVPLDVDYTKGMPASVGMMLNNDLSDCTSAAKYHARQVRTFVATGKMVTESDACVEKFYCGSCDYVPGNPDTDQGGNMQAVLAYLLKNGLPIGDGSQVAKIVGYLEVDARNPDDLMLAIEECGLIDIGFGVPAYLMPEDGSPPPLIWDVERRNRRIIGGHDVIQPGRTNGLYRTVSWGSTGYQMTERFFEAYVDEAYAVITAEWIEQSGKTPFGLTLADWQKQMAGIAAQT